MFIEASINSQNRILHMKECSLNTIYEDANGIVDVAKSYEFQVIRDGCIHAGSLPTAAASSDYQPFLDKYFSMYPARNS